MEENYELHWEEQLLVKDSILAYLCFVSFKFTIVYSIAASSSGVIRLINIDVAMELVELALLR